MKKKPPIKDRVTELASAIADLINAADLGDIHLTGVCAGLYTGMLEKQLSFGNVKIAQDSVRATNVDLAKIEARIERLKGGW